MKHLFGSRDKNLNWRGGRITANGYIRLLAHDHPDADRDGYVSEHKLIIEKHLGRYLCVGEAVHHKNRIRTDNRIENLEVLTKSIHAQLYINQRIKNGFPAYGNGLGQFNRVCVQCGNKFVSKKRKTGVCSSYCGLKKWRAAKCLHTK